MKSSVMNSVVEHDLCIGCGLCAALCPQDVLAMQWNRYGEYNPVEVVPCTTECGLCAKVCPFSDTGENEDTIAERLYGGIPGIQHRTETGYYLASYVGYSERHRPTSASGGMATWLLEALLAESIVDHVICVAPTDDPERLFAFRIFDTAEEVRTGAGSAYYPVEMSGVIKQVLEVPGRYAITGLPCFIKAIRLAQQRNKKLRERVVVTVGLVCGQLKSRHFTDYVAALAGVQGEVTGVRYRGKSPDQPVSNYHYTFTAADGEERRIFWKEGIAEVWTNRWFTLNACNYCDDVFAECADVTLMDAWLPRYSHDPNGTSLLIVRSQIIMNLVDKDRKSMKISVDTIDITSVIRSQKAVILSKTDDLAYRLHKVGQFQENLPQKRIQPSRCLNPLRKWKLNITSIIQEQSKKFIPNQHFSKEDIAMSRNMVYWAIVKLRFIEVLNFPFRIVHYLIRRI